MKWIKTETQLPNENKIYLCIKVTERKIFDPVVALYTPSSFKFTDVDGDELVPTHWAEIDLSDFD